MPMGVVNTGNNHLMWWAIVIILICAYSIYCSLIMKKNKVQEAFSAVDVQLQKRYDLIPNILTIAQRFMEHESGIMTKITELRSKALSMPNDIKSAQNKLAVDDEIKGLMGQLMVSVENYPVLKSDQTMLNAMQTYNEVEEHISAARRFFNSAVLELNNAVEIFPSSVIAGLMRIKKQEFYTAKEEAREGISAADFLK